jgi:hypothetical protein
MVDPFIGALRGLEFAEIRIHTLISLIFRGETEYRLDIEVPLELYDSGTEKSIQVALGSNGTRSTGITALADRVAEVVVSAHASLQAELKIEFGNGDFIRIMPNERFEAWVLFGPNRQFTGAMPGGGLM